MWTRGIGVKVNSVAVLVIVPAILWATPRYGAEGAAWVWVSLNAGYVLIAVHLMYRRILSAEKWRWYKHDLLAPLGAGIAVALLLKLGWPVADTLISELLLLGAAAILTAGAALLAAGQVRQQVMQHFKPYWTR